MSSIDGFANPVYKVNKWVGIDFDETLRMYDGGRPIMTMVRRIRHWLAMGLEIRIISARFAPDRDSPWIMANGGPDQEKFVQDWCEEHLGVRPVCQWGKSPGMIEFWDDKAVRVEANTGHRLSASDVERFGCGRECCIVARSPEEYERP
jgi:hypothetical protein